MVDFQTMIMMMNEGLHHAGILPDDRYITGTLFVSSMVVSAVLLIVFDLIVFSDENIARRYLVAVGERGFEMLVLDYLVVTQILIQFGQFEYALTLLGMMTGTFLLTYIVATKKEFEKVRRFLDEKFGWMF